MANERELLSKPEGQVLSFPANLKQAWASNETKMDQLQVFKTALALLKTASKQISSHYVK